MVTPHELERNIIHSFKLVKQELDRLSDRVQNLESQLQTQDTHSLIIPSIKPATKKPSTKRRKAKRK